ncbi:MAG: ketol-acid reductoisomerase [Dehalococcoidia bacterium]|nr:MAG: ketol-acid reductoisomerase [Dehalococcoidia bacterium]
MYYDKDADLKLLKGKTLGIVGFGSQGHAHAMNLRDSGCNVIVAEAKGSNNMKAAKKAGFKVGSAEAVAKEADIVTLLVPDNLHPAVYREMEKWLTKGKMLIFAHGFNIHYNQVVPPPYIDVTMVAPKCPGHMLRQTYTEGSGPPALVAVHQDATGKAKKIALAYAKGLGCTRAGVLDTTFLEETETDLFGEQTVLCGGVACLVKAAFETLIEAGYQPEIAYFECMHELKLIVDLFYQGGLSYMNYSVSDTAEYGGYVSGPRIIDSCAKEAMRQILVEIQDGSFATRWILENQAGCPSFKAMRRLEEGHEIEIVGRKLRKMMPWLKKK